MGADKTIAIIVCIAIFLGGMLAGWLPAHNKYIEFKSSVEQAGRDQAAQSKATDERNKRIKEENDAQRKTLLAANADLSRKLLDKRANSGYLPKASPTSIHPDRACFDRDQLDATIRFFDAGVQSLITEGDNYRIGIEVAKDWAKAIR